MFIKYLLSVLLDQRGEDDPGDGGDGQSVDLGEGADAGSADPNAGSGEGEGGQAHEGGAPAEPKYGELGDNPSVDDVFAKLKEAEEKANSLSGKTTATENNLAAVRKYLEGAGLKVLHDAEGNVTIVPKEGQTSQKQSRFNDTHKALFDANVLEAMEFLIQDLFDKRIGEYDGTRFTDKDSRWAERTSFFQKRGEANARMLQLYPQLAKGKKTFDKAFYDKATEIWKKSYKGKPNGELLAATEAASELGISPVTIMKAKKDGYNAGQAGKTVLGPVGEKGQGSKDFKKLSKDEYLKLSPEEKEVYDAKSKGLKR